MFRMVNGTEQKKNTLSWIPLMVIAGLKAQTLETEIDYDLRAMIFPSVTSTVFLTVK
jgi:hypothetical protein